MKLAAKHISDVDQEVEYLKMLVYGRNGKGKTFFGASGPKPIIIDANEQGTPSIRKVPDVKVFKVNTWTDIDLAYWYLKSGKHDRETCVVDTGTALASLCMKFVLGDFDARDPTREPQVPDQRVWGKVGQLLETEFTKFRSLDMNVIFLCQEKHSFSDDEDDVPEIGPSLASGKGREALTACVNIIGRIYTREVVVTKKVKGKKKSTKETQHRMLLGDHDLYITKTNVQDHGLPKIMKDPSIPKILAKING